MGEPEKKCRVIASNPQSATFILHNEDHTLGNSLRHLLAKNAKTDFCGYSVPHPSEPYVHIRLQTTKEPAVEVFEEGLNNLSAVASHIQDTFDEALLDHSNQMET